MSSSSYPILSMIIPLYNALIDHIEDFMDEEDFEENDDNSNDTDKEESTINLAAKNCRKKLLEYYNKTNDAYIIVTILDPRLKMEYYDDDEMWNEDERKEIREKLVF